MEKQKFCIFCGSSLVENAPFCPNCGALIEDAQRADSPEVKTESEKVCGLNTETAAIPAEPVKEKVLAGLLGALLFSLGGGVLHFLFYQASIISALSGFATVWLALLGYRMFSGNKKSCSWTCIIASVVLMLGVIFLAERVCLGFELYQLEGYDGSFVDAVRDVALLLEVPEVRGSYISDLAFAYIFGIAASAGTLINAIRARKGGVI